GSTFGPRAERVVAVKDLDARVDVGDPSEVPAERRRDDRDVDGQITAPEIFAARIASMSKPIDARIASVSPANSLAGRSSGGVRSNCTGLATSGRLRSSEYGTSWMKPLARACGSRRTSLTSRTTSHWPSWRARASVQWASGSDRNVWLSSSTISTEFASRS